MRANAFASELSYQVAEKRRRESELTTPQLHERFGVSYLLCQRPIVREAVIGARELAVDEVTWNLARLQRKQDRLA